ncbi:permease prefix domain 1-containing protein [Paenibacillus sp. OSY-SE]|uniref:permease prefix domain 1-containing protein n=1 Tax=Paenibacillus sp. OSY-SE TaxID=1196323 RepID=UPI0003154FA4|nr:permease prefix domain 1-containing protein [Paenibacillus sp. OSY-SE]
METIIVYLDNMFAGLPKTSEMKHLKQELLFGMEEKYVELKRGGKSENEAIGIVISEFGNIEELTAELGIHSTGLEQAVPVLTEKEVYAYTAARRSSGLWTGLGVFLCASGVALLLVLDTLFENITIMSNNSSMEPGTMLGLIGMFVLIAVAVGMFIHSGMKLDRYKSLEQGFQLSYALKMELQRNQALYAPTYRFSLITGVCLCVLSPVLIFVAAYVNDDFAPYGVAAFLLMAALAVFLCLSITAISRELIRSFWRSRTSRQRRRRGADHRSCGDCGVAFGDGSVSVHRLCLSSMGRQLGRIPNCRNFVRHVQQCLPYPESQKCLLIVLSMVLLLVPKQERVS